MPLMGKCSPVTEWKNLFPFGIMGARFCTGQLTYLAQAANLDEKNANEASFKILLAVVRSIMVAHEMETVQVSEM
jgi:hypothetical protein